MQRSKRYRHSVLDNLARQAVRAAIAEICLREPSNATFWAGSLSKLQSLVAYELFSDEARVKRIINAIQYKRGDRPLDDYVEIEDIAK